MKSTILNKNRPEPIKVLFIPISNISKTATGRADVLKNDLNLLSASSLFFKEKE